MWCDAQRRVVERCDAPRRVALRHLFLRAAQRLPPRRALRRARQRRVDDLLDLLEAEHEFRQRLPLQIIAQRAVVVHRRTLSAVMPAKAGIQYAGKAVIITGVTEYWIIRLRG